MRKKWKKAGTLFLLVTALATTVALAAYSEGSTFAGTDETYSPNSGMLTVTYNPSYVRTELSVTYSDARAAQIFADAYNEYYAGVDVKEDPNAAISDVMEAYSVATTLPNAKTDIERNDGDYADEVEAIPLGRLTGGTTYTMTGLWYDHRSTGAANGQEGRFCANSEESRRSVSDYNVIPGHYESLAQVYFGNVKGNT